MAKFRNVSGEPRLVGYGCPRQYVEPDGVITVVDAAAASYADQPIWEAVDKKAETTDKAETPAVTTK